MALMKTVFVDKQDLFLEGVKSLVKNDNSLEIDLVGVMSSAEELKDFLYRNIDTEAVFLDLNLPDADGLQLIPELRKTFRSIKICVLTSYDDYRYVKEALQQGAIAYLLKSNTLNNLKEAIEALKADETYIAPGLHITPPNGKRLMSGRKVVNGYEDRFMIKRKLTKREQEILHLITQAKNNKEIAKDLFISDQTVGVHRKNIMRKLGVRNTVNLIKFALEHQLV